MYQRTKWLDEVKDEHSEEIIQEGTDQSAAHFNNMEEGITDASVAAALLLIATGDLSQQTSIERKVVTLSNKQGYPFNDSEQTINLTVTRDSTDYTVDVRIYGKQTNGFKVAYDGSAKSATLILRVQGGM